MNKSRGRDRRRSLGFVSVVSRHWVGGAHSELRYEAPAWIRQQHLCDIIQRASTGLIAVTIDARPPQPQTASRRAAARWDPRARHINALELPQPVFKPREDGIEAFGIITLATLRSHEDRAKALRLAVKTERRIYPSSVGWS